MDIDYEITMNDMVSYNLYHHQHSSHLRRVCLMGRLGCSIVIGVIIFVILTFVVKTPIIGSLFGALVGVTLEFFAYPGILKRKLRKYVKKMYNEGQNKSTFCKHRLSLTPEAVIQTTDFGESKTQWNTVEKIVTTETHAFIYISAIAAYIVPKRAFTNEGEFNNFIEAAKHYSKNAHS